MNINEYPSQYKWNGIYRAKVVTSKDPLKQGRCKVWIPALMPEIDENMGIWARPANNPIGGRNSDPDSFYQGSCYIPSKGSYVFLFFEQGDPSSPFYFGSCDISTSNVLTENQQGVDYDEKWTLIKSKNGKVIIVSDDEYDERVEITGKKRLLSGLDPSGNPESVFQIDSNQSTILIDERVGNEKILIKDYNGNYININTSTNKIDIESSGEVQVKSATAIKITATTDLHIKSDAGLYLESNSINIKSNGALNISSTGIASFSSTANVCIDGATVLMQQGSSTPATSSTPAIPNGDRVDPSAIPNYETQVPSGISDVVDLTVIDNSLPTISGI